MEEGKARLITRWKISQWVQGGRRRSLNRVGGRSWGPSGMGERRLVNRIRCCLVYPSACSGIIGQPESRGREKNAARRICGWLGATRAGWGQDGVSDEPLYGGPTAQTWHKIWLHVTAGVSERVHLRSVLAALLTPPRMPQSFSPPYSFPLSASRLLLCRPGVRLGWRLAAFLTSMTSSTIHSCASLRRPSSYANFSSPVAWRTASSPLIVKLMDTLGKRDVAVGACSL